MVATNSLERELAGRGFRHLRRWTRGVDIDQFRPRAHGDEDLFAGIARPIALYVGRIFDREAIIGLVNNKHPMVPLTPPAPPVAPSQSTSK